MDYAVLTDNKGRKADCRHVVLIMTSNAGAQYARQASIGFNSQVTAGEAMLNSQETLAEFINRLSATVVFHMKFELVKIFRLLLSRLLPFDDCFSSGISLN